ncbi:AraC family transcriptional regulator [Variovorax boronicumulans]|uniref:AraC family transcriptional regulator n=1 Tax=Variovorax boronicumulans TaxID=436515 RepID=UPI002789459F|nr:helix-turn-helix domain-containing protein [Variovorax boronicumulans]MDQ0085205.1 AraC family transcriptional regulator [Variovorax boronicumulans]
MDERVLSAMRAIEASLEAPLSITQLAADCGLSQFHFNRLFRAEAGEPPASYARRLRLERAALRLRGSNAPLGLIAAELGYGSLTAFGRAFAARFGITPLDWRRTLVSDTVFNPETDKAGPVTIRRVNAFSCISRRYFGGYHKVPSHWDDFARAMPPGLQSAAGSFCVGIAYDDPRLTAEELIRYDCCLVPGAAAQMHARQLLQQTGFRALATRAGRYAALEHRGPYSRIESSYSFLYDHWSPGSRYTMSNDPALEIYAGPPVSTVQCSLRFTILYPIE